MSYFAFSGNFQVQAPGGDLYSERRFHGWFFVLQVWGAYIWLIFYFFDFLRYTLKKFFFGVAIDDLLHL